MIWQHEETGRLANSRKSPGPNWYMARAKWVEIDRDGIYTTITLTGPAAWAFVIALVVIGILIGG